MALIPSVKRGDCSIVMKTILQVLTIVILLIIIFVMGTFLYWKIILSDGKTKNVTTSNVPTSAMTLLPEIENTITLNGNKVIIQGTTNLPDGTNVKYNLWHLDKLSAKNNVEKVVAVQNKTLSCEIVFDGKINAQEMTLNSEVFFNNNNQPDSVKKILGDKGQNLSGSNVKYTGEYKALLFQDKFAFPDDKVEKGTVANEKANLSDEDKIRAVITKAVNGLSGIEIYKRNGKYAVEASYDLVDGLYLKSAAEKVARDFTFAAYATGLPILRTSIIINKPDGIMGLSVSVGNNQATKQPASTWTDSKIGPTIFMDWVKKNSNEDYKNLENHTTAKYNF